jgi:magnesium-transporting ATPase (P-type)
MHRDTREIWHDQPSPTLTAQFHTDVLSGLTPSEAARRLQQCGPSELRKATTSSPLVLLMGQFGHLVI